MTAVLCYLTVNLGLLDRQFRVDCCRRGPLYKCPLFGAFGQRCLLSTLGLVLNFGKRSAEPVSRIVFGGFPSPNQQVVIYSEFQPPG